MSELSYCTFDTALGHCGLIWNEAEAVVGFDLPPVAEDRLARRTNGRQASQPSPEIQRVMDLVRKHLTGDPQDFRTIRIEMGGIADLARAVYVAIREIPVGETRTYGQIALQIGHPHAAQAVGQALGSNPIPLIVPCHRIVAAGGKPGGFSAPGGLRTKEILLELEGGLAQPSLFS